MPEKQNRKEEKGQRGAEKKYIRETNRTNRGVKKGYLYMTKVSNLIPSVLVEGGFMTNKEAAALLKSDAYRQKAAIAIVKGLVDTFKLKLKPNTLLSNEGGLDLNLKRGDKG